MRSWRAAAAYVAAWLVAAAVVALIAVALLDGDDGDSVSIPPVTATRLGDAARTAGCELRRERPGEHFTPPVSGPAGAPPAAAGFYEDAPDVRSLISALRRGKIIIYFRADLDPERLDSLRAVQAAAPNGTIVMPEQTATGSEIVVTAYRRMLRCPRLTHPSFDALQLFRGRYLGSGPDR